MFYSVTATGRGSQWVFRAIVISALLYELCWCNGDTRSQQMSRISAYEVTVPKRIERQRRDLDDQNTDKVFYAIQTQGQERVLVLERNRLLLPGDFTIYTYHSNGSVITNRPNIQDHCYYRGYVEDVEDSSASLSLCSGLNGQFVIGSSTFGIEPLEGSSDFEHMVYRLEDEETEPVTCGTTHTHRHDDETVEHTLNDIVRKLDRDLHRSKRAIRHQTHYVELMLVVDEERFNYSKRDKRVVQEQMIQLTNQIDSMYTPLNIRVVLVGLEIWTAGNPISLDGDGHQILRRFVSWRKKYLLPRQPHDIAQFIMKKSLHTRMQERVYFNAVCSPDIGGGINMFVDNNIPHLAFVMSHGLGHNLGLKHDNHRSCHCPKKTCIMDSSFDRSSTFSSCSVEDFEMVVQQMEHNCLLNMPMPLKAFSKPACGNKLLEPGEECDCGSEEECKKDPCCEPKTCKLKSWAQCAYGECCRNCKFLPAGFECRSRSDECDLPEYCSGSSPVCQADVYVQNGHPCRNNQSYCYSGKCQYHDGQCQALFGSQAKGAVDTCFEFVNSKNDRFGNCGFSACQRRNALCGKLQCDNVHSSKVFGIRPAVSSTTIGSHTCSAVDLMLGMDVFDPVMVNDGTKCGENKVCLDYQCSDASLLNYDCDTQKKCHGHGVCNNKKNCHCDHGWAPPFCKEKGYGGSIDSGPVSNDTSARDGLLVFFFLVLPLLCIGLIVFLKWNKLQQYVCRNKSPHDNQAAPHSPQVTYRLPVVSRETQRSAVNNVDTSNKVFSITQQLPKPPFRPSPTATQVLPHRPPPRTPVSNIRPDRS